jgi:oxygen-independent coproporphyrinogen-3 oxidase
MSSVTAPAPSAGLSTPVSRPPKAPDAAAEAAPDPGFGLYVHWPFCLAKCPYCDFNSHVRAEVEHGRWRRALLAELDHFAARAPSRTLTSIFFGGGTPSLMAPETVAALIERAGFHWPLAANLEITLEANPTSVEAARLAAFRAAGVNRVSLGVQALDDASLKFLGRGHGAAEACRAVELAAGLFPRYSFDLIYGRPGQTLSAWRGELGRALAMAGDHLSLYTLTIEDGTAFAGQVARGVWQPPPADNLAALYAATVAICAERGLPAYEISNHAAPGGECRHNLTYWRYGDYVGIGPGAHGRIGAGDSRRATRQWRKPETWLAQVEKAGHGGEADEPVPGDERASEALLMGLRLKEGIHLDNFARQVGVPFEQVVAADRLARLLRRRLLRRDGRRIAATERGRMLLDAVLAELMR